jgi:hypothetical protein
MQPMADPDVSPTDPTLEGDLRFQRRLWRVERASWWVELGIVVAGLAGLLGGGPLSRGTVESGGLAVEYPRIGRAHAPAELTVRIQPSLVRGGEVRVQVDSRWIEGVEIERIVPEPERSEAGSEATGFTFRVQEGVPARVRFSVKQLRPGRQAGKFAVPGGAAVTLSQWIYP